jgi:hypothetical protein
LDLFAKRVLRRVRPAALLVSGDLTDSKTARGVAAALRCAALRCAL